MPLQVVPYEEDNEVQFGEDTLEAKERRGLAPAREILESLCAGVDQFSSDVRYERSACAFP